MELHQVRYFVALCNSLNFTRAAQACQVTQPALTRGIQRLEEELGGALFARERNLTQLTELGRLMRPSLEHMLMMAETAISNANRFNKNELASLRIGLPPTVSADLAMSSLSEVARRIPMLEAKLISAPQTDIIARLLESELDSAFLVEAEPFPKQLNTWRLHTEGYHLAMGPANDLAHHRLIAVRDLQEQALIGCTDCPGIANLQQQCKAGGLTVRVPFIVDTYDQAQHIAASGLGVAILPERLPLSPSLVSRRLANTQMSRALVMAVVNGRRFSPALNAFVKLVRARDYGAAQKP